MPSPESYTVSKQRLSLIEAVVGSPEVFTEAWTAPHAKMATVLDRWPSLSDHDARVYAVRLGLGSRPGRIVAVEAEPAEPETGITLPAASVDRLVDALAEAVAGRVYDLLEERLNRKARRGLFGTGR